jgi:hypothetical protein
MIAIGIFYLLFFILLILLIFTILLYSGYHSRTLVSGLLDNFYGLSITGAGDIPANTSNPVDIYLTDGKLVKDAGLGVEGSLEFNTNTSTAFAFRPDRDDSQRKLRGHITFVASKLNENVPNIKLSLKDEGDGKIVGTETEFGADVYTEGLTEFKLYFTSNSLSNNDRHRFVLQGRSATGNVITANNFLIYSAYIYYY